VPNVDIQACIVPTSITFLHSSDSEKIFKLISSKLSLLLTCKEVYFDINGLGIEIFCRCDIQHPCTLALRPERPPKLWVPGLLPWVKRPEFLVSHPPPSGTEFK